MGGELLKRIIFICFISVVLLMVLLKKQEGEDLILQGIYLWAPWGQNSLSKLQCVVTGSDKLESRSFDSLILCAFHFIKENMSCKYFLLPYIFQLFTILGDHMTKLCQ